MEKLIKEITEKEKSLKKDLLDLAGQVLLRVFEYYGDNIDSIMINNEPSDLDYYNNFSNVWAKKDGKEYNLNIDGVEFHDLLSDPTEENKMKADVFMYDIVQGAWNDFISEKLSTLYMYKHIIFTMEDGKIKHK